MTLMAAARSAAAAAGAVREKEKERERPLPASSTPEGRKRKKAAVTFYSREEEGGYMFLFADVKDRTPLMGHVSEYCWNVL